MVTHSDKTSFKLVKSRLNWVKSLHHILDIKCCLNEVLKWEQPKMCFFPLSSLDEKQKPPPSRLLHPDNLQSAKGWLITVIAILLLANYFDYKDYHYLLCVCLTLYLKMKVSECFTVVWVFSVRIRHRLTNLYLFINQQSQDQYLPVSSSKHHKEQVKW